MDRAPWQIFWRELNLKILSKCCSDSKLSLEMATKLIDPWKNIASFSTRKTSMAMNYGNRRPKFNGTAIEFEVWVFFIKLEVPIKVAALVLLFLKESKKRQRHWGDRNEISVYCTDRCSCNKVINDSRCLVNQSFNTWKPNTPTHFRWYNKIPSSFNYKIFIEILVSLWSEFIFT